MESSQVYRATASAATLSDGAIFKACVENSNDAILLTDALGIIFYVNPAWERLFEYPKAEVLGKTPRVLRSGHHPPSYYADMWKDILDPAKGFWRGEVVNISKSGREVPVLLTISYFREIQNDLTGYMSVALDLTERRKLEMQLQWQDRLTTIGLLAGGIAHELGTPLGVARGRAEYLLQSFPEGAVERSSLESIVSQIDRVSTVMQSLQGLAVDHSGDNAIAISLKSAVERMLSLVRAKVESYNISFLLEISEDAKILAEPSKFTQVLLNLCLNSLQAIEAQQRKGLKENHQIKLRIQAEEQFCTLSISDTGGGIPPENIPHLFKPFFTTKEIGEGTGLGLAIVHQAVHSWGGSIHLENDLGKGANFIIRLPKV